MKKELSPKQLAANRRNAKRSTGPKTPQGKARVAHNALKHGILARCVVAGTKFVSETPGEFQSLLADLIAELKPESLIEETLVERIATCYWRLARAQRYETGAIKDRAHSAASIAPESNALRRDLREAETALAIERRLDQLLNMLDTELTEQERTERNDSFSNFVQLYALDRNQLDPADLKRQVRERLPDIVRALQQKVDRLRQRRKIADAEQTRHRTKNTLLGSLPESDALLKVIRYETMLDRQLHRALECLDRVQRVRRRRKRKKRTCETNPSDRSELEIPIDTETSRTQEKPD